MRQRKFYPQQEFVTITENVPNVATPIFALKPPVNSFIGVPRFIYPIIKLRDENDDPIDSNSVVSVGVETENQDVAKFFPGTFALHYYNDLTTQQQRDPKYAKSIEVDLGKKTALTNEDSLVFFLKSGQTVSWANSTVEFETNIETVG